MTYAAPAPAMTYAAPAMSYAAPAMTYAAPAPTMTYAAPAMPPPTTATTTVTAPPQYYAPPQPSYPMTYAALMPMAMPMMTQSSMVAYPSAPAMTKVTHTVSRTKMVSTPVAVKTTAP